MLLHMNLIMMRVIHNVCFALIKIFFVPKKEGKNSSLT